MRKIKYLNINEDLEHQANKLLQNKESTRATKLRRLKTRLGNKFDETKLREYKDR